MCRDSTPLEKAVQFHGHICPGLIYGVKAAEFAMKYLEVEPDEDEELVAIVEHNSCGVDAIQAILSCTFGKGNLIFKDYGKHAYTVISRKSGKALRMHLKFNRPRTPEEERYRALTEQEFLRPENKDEMEELRGRILADLLSKPFQDLFDYEEVEVNIPDKAKIYPTVQCEVCKEGVMEPRARRVEGKWICQPCLERREGIKDV